MAERNVRLVVTGGPKIDAQHDAWVKARRRAKQRVDRLNRRLRGAEAHLRRNRRRR